MFRLGQMAGATTLAQLETYSSPRFSALRLAPKTRKTERESRFLSFSAVVFFGLTR
jgi:hypothetical protein